MVGQFHPACPQPGLWSEDFRPLQAPIPLLAIRHMVSSDLPFLMSDERHILEYMKRFAPGVPSHVLPALLGRMTF
jgi:hypothetical protein